MVTAGPSVGRIASWAANRGHHPTLRWIRVYARFAVDRGTQRIVAGTGGRQLASEAMQAVDAAVTRVTYGVLRLTLFPGRYQGAFLGFTGQILDTFSGTCH